MPFIQKEGESWGSREASLAAARRSRPESPADGSLVVRDLGPDRGVGACTPTYPHGARGVVAADGEGDPAATRTSTIALIRLFHHGPGILGDSD